MYSLACNELHALPVTAFVRPVQNYSHFSYQADDDALDFALVYD